MDVLASLNLNLLIVLEALLDERNLTRAGERIGLSQPAVSGSLKRLRIMFGDLLLERVGNEMRLTARARRLQPQVHQSLQALRELLQDSETFDPARSAGLVRISTTDHVIATLWPILQPQVERRGPHVDVQFSTFSGIDETDRLQDEKVDLVIGSHVGVGPMFRRQLLWSDRSVCLMWTGHPVATVTAEGETIPLDAYLAHPHVRIAGHRQHKGFVDTALAELGIERRIAVELPNALPTPLLLSGTNMLAVITERLARASSQILPVCFRELPVRIPDLETHMIWHSQLDDLALHRWFRSQIEAAADELMSRTPSSCPASPAESGIAGTTSADASSPVIP